MKVILKQHSALYVFNAKVHNKIIHTYYMYYWKMNNLQQNEISKTQLKLRMEIKLNPKI